MTKNPTLVTFETIHQIAALNVTSLECDQFGIVPVMSEIVPVVSGTVPVMPKHRN